jgi:hypothetical protein
MSEARPLQSSSIVDSTSTKPFQTKTTDPTKRPPIGTDFPKATTTVGLYGGSSWRTNTDYVRTVSFMSQMFTRQEGRAHRWIIDGSPLMSMST